MKATIDHIGIYMNDLEAAKTFFETFFQAKSHPPYHNVRTGFRSYFLTFGDSFTRLELMNRPETKTPESTAAYAVGYHHLSVSVGSKEQVDALASQLSAAGYPVLDGPRTTGDGYYECCVQGPENLNIEITV